MFASGFGGLAFNLPMAFSPGRAATSPVAENTERGKRSAL
jgi:hypothetical protein